MSYILTQHARDAMEKRKIAISWLEQAFYTPESTEPDRIVTVFPDRRRRLP